MADLLTVLAAGFAASMVDGALGMGFGPTSSSILLSAGLPPAAVSATVNIAKVASGAAAGLSHWKFGNVDKRLVARLAVPGSIGALIGATVLKNVDGDALRPWLAVMLLVVGARILFRFSRTLPAPASADHRAAPLQHDQLRGVETAGAAGGITNGLIGAWGPVVTPFLLQKGVSPRVTVGSVNTAEMAVAAVAAASLTTTTRGGGLDTGVVLAILVGGVLAAPLAAWLVRFFPPRVMGVTVAGLLLFTNVRELVKWGNVGPFRWACYGLILMLAGLAAIGPRLRRRDPAFA